MLARRIIALSPDKAFAKQLAVALKAAGGSVASHLVLEELGPGEIHASLVVMHLDGAMTIAAATLIPRMVGETRVIAFNVKLIDLSRFIASLKVGERGRTALLTNEGKIVGLATPAMRGEEDVRVVAEVDQATE